MKLGNFEVKDEYGGTTFTYRNTIKVIDLFYTVMTDKNIPKIIKYDNKTWEFDNKNQVNGCYDYICYDNHGMEFFFPKYLYSHCNDEVEIIEEEKKIPEKLDYIHPDISCSYNESELLLRIEANKDKINEIIDKVNELDTK